MLRGENKMAQTSASAAVKAAKAELSTMIETIKKDTAVMIKEWDRLFAEYIKAYRSGEIGEEEYRELLDDMQSAALMLQRQAESVAKQIKDDVSKNKR
jgi:hypothetical protein